MTRLNPLGRQNSTPENPGLKTVSEESTFFEDLPPKIPSYLRPSPDVSDPSVPGNLSSPHQDPGYKSRRRYPDPPAKNKGVGQTNVEKG